MTIYTTLRPKYLIEYFGDAYNPETHMLKDPSARKGHKIETYYHQDVRDSDLFLMIPRFSQVTLITRLKEKNINPMYVTLYKEKKPENKLWEDVGIVYEANEFLDILPAIIELSPMKSKFSTLTSILSHLSIDISEKKRQQVTDASFLDVSNKPVNNPNYSPLHMYEQFGTRGIYKADERHRPKYKIGSFDDNDIKYYCVFTHKKVYFFQDTSNASKSSASQVAIIEKYLDYYLNIPTVEEISHNRKSVGSMSQSIEENKKQELIIKKDLELNSLLVMRPNDDQVCHMQITIPSQDQNINESIFDPIPISIGDVYEEFYFFIDLALSQKKLYLGNYDGSERSIELFFSKERFINDAKEEEKESTFYYRYALYFLAQYTKTITDIVLKSKETEEKDQEKKKAKQKTKVSISSTLFTILGHLAITNYGLAGATLLENFLKPYISGLDADEIKKYTSSNRLELYDFFMTHQDPNDYFSKDKETTDRIFNQAKKLKTFSRLERGNKYNKNYKQEELTEEQIKIQQYICNKKLKEPCLSEKDREPICGKYTGEKKNRKIVKRFQTFDQYFDYMDINSYYYKLSKKCKNKLHEYWSMTAISPEDISEDEMSFNDLDMEYDPSSSIMKLHEVLSGHHPKTLEKLIYNFLKSYEEFLESRNPLDILYHLDKESYNRVLTKYLITSLGTMDNQPQEIKDARNFVVSVLFLLSKETKVKNRIGDDDYYQWISSFFQLMIIHEIVDIVSVLDNNRASWIELKQILSDPIVVKNYEQCKDILPKDIDLEDGKEIKLNILIQAYIQSIIDVHEHIDSTLDLIEVGKIVRKLQYTYKHSNTNKKGNPTTKDYPLFKHYLLRNSPEYIMSEYLDTVIIEGNDEYFEERR